MPTPTWVFAEIAARVGGVDPCDLEAVQRFYVEVLPGLDRRELQAILTELLAREGEECEEGEDPRPCYPSAASPPRLSHAPPAPLPRLARGWRAFLVDLARLGRRP